VNYVKLCVLVLIYIIIYDIIIVGRNET